MRKLSQIVRDAMAAHHKGRPLNDRGQLIPDPVPMAPPIGFKPQPSMVDIIRQQVRLASLDAAREGKETLEEADDFDVGDEPELRSQYELDEEGEVPIRVLEARAAEAREEYLEAKRAAGLRMQEDSGRSVGPQQAAPGAPKPQAPQDAQKASPAASSGGEGGA